MFFKLLTFKVLQKLTIAKFQEAVMYFNAKKMSEQCDFPDLLWPKVEEHRELSNYEGYGFFAFFDLIIYIFTQIWFGECNQ